MDSISSLVAERRPSRIADGLAPFLRSSRLEQAAFLDALSVTDLVILWALVGRIGRARQRSANTDANKALIMQRIPASVPKIGVG